MFIICPVATRHTFFGISLSANLVMIYRTGAPPGRRERERVVFSRKQLFLSLQPALHQGATGGSYFFALCLAFSSFFATLCRWDQRALVT